MVDTTTADPALGLPSIFWSPGSTEGLSYEQLKQRRAIAAALASRSRPYPTTIGQGIASLGESFGDAMYERATQQAEREQSALDRRAREAAGGAGATSPPPASSGTGRRSAIDAPNQTYASLTDSILAQSGTSTPPDVSLEPPAASAPQPAPAGGPAPMMTRMAALNTGPTASDAGQPGATYGGPSPAGPGASTAEPPVDNPAAPSVLPTAAAAAASPPGPVGTPAPGATGGGQVPRAALAGMVMAQAGTRPPVPARAPTAPAQPPGQVTAPAITGVPATGQPRPGSSYPESGETRLTPPVKPADPRTIVAPVREDTPQMKQIQGVLADPQYRNITPMQREQLTKSYLLLKEARDKEFDRQDERYRKERDDNLEQWKTYRKDVQEFPKLQQEAADREMKNTRMRRFGPAADEIDKTTVASAAKGEALVPTLRMIPQLNSMVDQMFSGTGAEGKLNILKFMNAADRTVLGPIFGNRGYFTNEIEATEAFKSAISSVVASTLKSISGTSGITEGERAYAEKAAAGNIEMEPGSIKRVLDIVRRAGVNSIRDHNDRMDKVYDDPQRNDAAMHRMFKVQMPAEAFDPTDLMHLQATQNSPEERARFDSIYGNGSARRVTGFGR